MKNLVYLIMLISLSICAQSNRVQIKGTVTSTVEGPLLGITVFNANTMEGTITNDQGVFYIEVKEGDEILFKALQLETFTLTISPKIIVDKETRLQLKEDVKELQVIDLSNQISMRIPITRLQPINNDLDKVSADNINTAAVDRMENTFSDRKRKPSEYPVRHEAFDQTQPRFNVFGPSAVINTSRIAKSLDPKNYSADNEIPDEENPIVLLKNKYSKEFFMSSYHLKENEIIPFIYYAVDKGLTKNLIQSENPLELLEFLTQQSLNFHKR